MKEFLENILSITDNKLFLSIIKFINSEISIKIIISIITLLLIWFIRFIVIKIVWKRTEKIKVRYNWKKSSGYVSIILILIILGLIWIKGFQSITTILALVAAGFVIILKDPIMNFIGWIFIISRRSVEVGDRIQINNLAGDIIDINIFYFTIMEIGNWVKADQSTGRIIHIPNNFIIIYPLINYTKGLEFLWNEMPVIITFESNWQKAKQLLSDIVNNYEINQSSKLAEQKVKDAANKFFINYSKFTPIVYTNVIENGVCLTIRYLCEPRKRRESESFLWEKILIEFNNHSDIDFAYPTQRFFNNIEEGRQQKENN